MSADVYLEVPAAGPCPHCGGTGKLREDEDVAHLNVTYNLSPMLAAVGWSWGIARAAATAADLLEPLQAAYDKLAADPERFCAMNPSNGWGSYDRLLPEIRKFLAACRQTPTARVRTYL